jgi:hypothetical protein
MKAGFGKVAIFGLAALAAGCAGTGAVDVRPGAEVTRFHLGNNPARGEIAIEPLDPAMRGSFEFGRIAAAVERQLALQGWRVVQNPRSEQVATVTLEQSAREGARRRSGLSIGIGGGTYGGGVGVGGGVTLPIGGGSRAGQVVLTQLSVRLQRRSDGTAIWEGRAHSEAAGGTPQAQPAIAAEQLAAALFQGFPGESGRTIRVP